MAEVKSSSSSSSSILLWASSKLDNGLSWQANISPVTDKFSSSSLNDDSTSTKDEEQETLHRFLPSE